MAVVNIKPIMELLQQVVAVHLDKDLQVDQQGQQTIVEVEVAVLLK